MDLIVHKSSLKGSVSIPGSKSHTIRAVAAASLANGISTVRNPLASSDTLSAVAAYRTLGAKIDTRQAPVWTVEGTGGDIRPTEAIIDIGNSGTTLKIAAGSAALAPEGTEIEITGDHQIQARPIQPLMDSLEDLGAKAYCIQNNGSAPIRVGGRLKGGKTTIECVTSQYLTSLLMACPLAGGDSEIEVSLLYEGDYVRMTLDWLDKLGIQYTNEDFKRFHIPGRQAYPAFERTIPADFSSATFFLCAGALSEDGITLEGLDFSDSQPDKAVADYLREMGANIRVDGTRVHVKRGQLHGASIDMNRTPDALPMMAVTAAFAEGKTRLYNVAQARKKETDRIAVMAAELRKLGVWLEELPDGLVVHHCPLMKSAEVKGHGDHRVVMALAVAGLNLPGEMVIDTAEAMNVTFPNFTDLMQSLGGELELRKEPTKV